MDLQFGLGSWSNPHFDHGLYPLHTPHVERLPRYASLFDVVEADILHHQRVEEDTLADWLAATPAGFEFLPKLHKNVTHGGYDGLALRFLDDMRPALAQMKEAGKLGPVLAQFPASFRPTDANQAWLSGLLSEELGAPFVVEFRHKTWFTPETEALLRAHDAGLVWSTWDRAKAPAWETLDLGYVRLVGTVGKKRGRWVTQKDRVEDLLDLRQTVAGASFERAYVIVTNRFEGNAIDSLPRAAAALGADAFAQRCRRRPTEALLPG